MMQNLKKIITTLALMALITPGLTYARGGAIAGAVRAASPATRAAVGTRVRTAASQTQATGAAAGTTTTSTTTTTTTTTTKAKVPPTLQGSGVSVRVKRFFLLTNFRNVATITMGTSITEDAGEDEIFRVGGVTYRFSANHAHRAQTLYGVYFGREFDIKPKLFMQIGLGYYQAASYKTRGNLYQGVVPFGVTPYQYTYTFISRRLIAEGKLLTSYRPTFHPYFLFGAGVSFNTTYDYQVFNPPGVVSPVFQGSAANGFAYEVGVGFDWDIQKDIRLGVGYRFTDLGNVDLGHGFLGGAPIRPSLSQTHLYANEFLGQLSYVF